MRLILILLFSAFVAGCVKVDYIRPTAQPTPSANVKLINKPRELVWNASVPELSKRFFVINNLDKSSGLINVSYTGDPEKYIDCGQITLYVGERTYDFAGAKAQQSYQVIGPGLDLISIERKMSLDGRANLIFEEIGPSQTRVTAHARYIVQRHMTSLNTTNNISHSRSDNVSFNSGGSSSFPAASSSDSRALECVATGELEREILSAIK